MKRPLLSLRRFARDCRGVSAIEFAIIAPLLITFYLGMAETTQAMMAKRKASHVASAIGDLIAQDQSVTDAEIADTWTGIPAGLIANGQSLIIAETKYPYDSPIKKYVPARLNFSDVYYLRPRKIITVQRAP